MVVVVMLVVSGVLVVLEEVEAAVVQVDTRSGAARERPLQQQAPPLGQHQ